MYDDNTDLASTRQLHHADVDIVPTVALPDASYRRGEDTHHWDAAAVRRVAAIKNHAIDLFLATSHTQLFLVDSDVLLPAGGLTHLADARLQVLAAVYWTRWTPDSPPQPNVFPITSSLLTDLQHPGHWPVDGLGACTLIQRHVLDQVRFDEASHLATEGEDRWFCWRCHQARIPLAVCTHIEPFHVYRDTDLSAANEWMSNR